MSKLYFFYGCMGSSKTAQALMMAYNFREKGKKVAVCMPEIAFREKPGKIYSRTGMEMDCIPIPENAWLMPIFEEEVGQVPYDCIIIDEAQFLSSQQVDTLDVLSHAARPLDVFCFGLRTDFTTYTFPGSKRLLEIADKIKEIKTMCICGNKAKYNARLNEDRYVVTEGPSVLIAGNSKYIALCHTCYQHHYYYPIDKEKLHT